MKSEGQEADRPIDVLLDSLTVNEHKAITDHYLSDCICMFVGRTTIEQNFGVDWTDAEWKKVKDKAEDYWDTPWEFAFELVEEAAHDLGYELPGDEYDDDEDWDDDEEDEEDED